MVNYTVVDSSPLFPDSTIENLAIEVDVDGAKLLAINVYIPPTSSVPGFTPNLNPLFDITRDVLVMRDFNAHDERWQTHTLDTAAAARGDAICSALDFGELMCNNENSHTRRPQNDRLYSPDHIFTNPHLGINARWKPPVILKSDHLPIIADLNRWFTSPLKSTGPSCYTYYRKTNWAHFTQETEQDFIRL